MSSENKEEKIKVIMLVGEGHSGSTLLDLIMNSHSQILGVGEISHYSRMRKYDVLCGCGKGIPDCDFWNKAIEGVDYKFLPLIGRSVKDFIFNPDNFVYFEENDVCKKLNTEKYIEETEKLYRNALALSGKKMIFDSSKLPGRAEMFIRSGKFDIVLLHLVRDGRGVVYSNIKLGRQSFFYMKRWAKVNLKTEIIKIRNRDIKKIFILYKDFVNNPEGIVKYILEQINFIFEPKMLNFNDFEQHQVGGNFKVRMPNENKNKIFLDDKWKKQMPVKYKLIFDLIFGWLNVFYKLKPKKYDR